MRDIKTAFVTSTLPARFLLDNWPSLNISQLICGSDAIKSSFQFLKEKFPEVKILSLPSNRDERVAYLLEEVENSKLSIVIFHECCWLELDIAILKVQPVVEYYPSVTLNGWKKLTIRELGFFTLLSRFVFETNKNILKLIYWSYRHKTDFDFYEHPEDNRRKNSFDAAFKESRVLRLKKSNKNLISRQLLKRISSKKNSKNIILIIGMDIVESKLQEEIFYKVANTCEKFGYKILVKNHPNPSYRLNLKGLDNAISPYIPFEVVEESYFIKIGLFSTALTFEPANSISIANLFSPLPEEFQNRRNHVTSIPGGDQIKFIKNLEELEKILQLDLKTRLL